ncbi:MAG: PspC domain-containing protein [Thermoclostridium sp.]|nr:PspC domain-containing protein [Thermoclostridium sp.]
MEKKLTLSDTNKVVGGVCGGVGEYLGVDPTAIRLVCAILTFVTGVFGGVLLYIVAMFIMPRK